MTKPREGEGMGLAEKIAERIVEAARPKVTGDFQQDCEAWPEQGITTEQMTALIREELLGSELVKAAEKVRCEYCGFSIEQHVIGGDSPNQCISGHKTPQNTLALVAALNELRG